MTFPPVLLVFPASLCLGKVDFLFLCLLLVDYLQVLFFSVDSTSMFIRLETPDFDSTTGTVEREDASTSATDADEVSNFDVSFFGVSMLSIESASSTCAKSLLLESLRLWACVDVDIER